MGRSQRHMVLEQGSTAAGEIHAQGAVAPGIAMQVDATELNVMEPGPASPPVVAVLETTTPPPDLTNVVVPSGPPGGPLQGSSLTGAIPEELQPPEPPEPPEPEETAPVVDYIAPASAVIGSTDFTLRVVGSRFVEDSVIVFNGGDEQTVFVNETELTTGVKPSLAGVAITVPVQVRNAGQVSNSVSFEFTEGEPAARSEQEPSSGPFTIRMIEDHDDGIAILLNSSDEFEEGNLDIEEGDLVRVEATGNTSINGDYDVLTVDGMTIIVNNMFTLAASIENKGRVTVITEED